MVLISFFNSFKSPSPIYLSTSPDTSSSPVVFLFLISLIVFPPHFLKYMGLSRLYLLFLSDKPDDNIPNAQVTNTCLPAEERPNKTPLFNSVDRNARTILARLRSSCPSGLTAQLKAENLMFVASTANGFRAAVSALWSLDGGRV